MAAHARLLERRIFDQLPAWIWPAYTARTDAKGACMVQRRQRERSLFEVFLPDGHKLWPAWLRQVDQLLDDEAVIDVIADALAQRWPESRRRGRAPDAGSQTSL